MGWKNARCCAAVGVGECMPAWDECLMPHPSSPSFGFSSPSLATSLKSTRTPTPRDLPRVCFAALAALPCAFFKHLWWGGLGSFGWWLAGSFCCCCGSRTWPLYLGVRSRAVRAATAREVGIEDDQNLPLATTIHPPTTPSPSPLQTYNTQNPWHVYHTKACLCLFASHPPTHPPTHSTPPIHTPTDSL